MLKFSVHTEGLDAIADQLTERCSRAEHALAIEVERSTYPYVPMLNGVLLKGTRVIGDKIIYPGPYARYLYYGKVMVNAETGAGPNVFIGKDGNEYIRFPKGSKLKATDRDLKYNKSIHKQAQSRWFEASKKKNLGKWKKMLEKELKDGK